MACLEFFICLVITAFYENRITWDEERLEEIAALLEVVGEKICTLLIFWGMWKFCHICVCTSNTQRHKVAHWKSSAPGPARAFNGDEKKFSVKLNWHGHGSMNIRTPKFYSYGLLWAWFRPGGRLLSKVQCFLGYLLPSCGEAVPQSARNCAGTGVITNLNP